MKSKGAEPKVPAKCNEYYRGSSDLSGVEGSGWRSEPQLLQENKAGHFRWLLVASSSCQLFCIKAT